MFSRTFALSLAILPALVSAGLFAEGGPVKNLQEAVFRKTLKAEKTAVVAFVAPWCGHCKKLTPEFTKAAKSLSPLIDFYAVDCDADENKRLCAEQGIKGFPTIKSFPRGLKGAPHEYRGERTASSIVSWAGSEVPSRVDNVKGEKAVTEWAAKDTTKPRALLLTTQPKIPVLWKVLASRYYKNVSFAAAKDESGAIARSLGQTSGEKSKVVVWTPGNKEANTAEAYDGKLKFEPLAKYFESLAVVDSDAPNPRNEL